MKKRTLPKSILTMLSVLSVLFGFAALCLGNLFLLDSLGVITLPLDPAGDQTPAFSGDAADDLGVFDCAPQAVQRAPITGSASDALLSKLPFVDRFYLSVRVTSADKDSPYAGGSYEIWRSGEKYRIHRYDAAGGGIVTTTICDGQRVQIMDYTTTSITYAALDEAHSFEKMAPLPDFSALLSDAHSFTSYEETADSVYLTVSYSALLVSDHVLFEKASGIVTDYRRLDGEELLLAISVEMVDTEYAMADYIFALG